MIVIRLLVAAMHAATPTPAAESRAPATSALALADVMRDVERTYPPLLAARAEQQAGQGELLAALGAFDTVIRAGAAADPLGYYRGERLDALVEQPTTLWGSTFYGGWRWGRGEFAPYDAKLATAELGEARAGLRVPLLRNGPIDRRRADILKLELAAAMAGWRTDQQRLETLRLAATRYWEWAIAGQRLRLTRMLLATAVRRDAQLRETIRLGDAAALEGTENARAIQQRRTALAAAERSFQQAAIELSLLWRDASGAPRLAGEALVPAASPPVNGLEPARIEALAAQAARRRPEVRRLLAQATQSEIEARWATNQHLPALDLLSEISQDVGPGPAALAPTAATVGVTFDLPLQRRGAGGRLQAAEATARAAETQAAFMRDRVVAEVRDAGAAVSAAASGAAFARREAELSHALAEGEWQRFRLGASSLLLVNLREQGAFEAAIREVEARGAYHRALATLQAASAEALEPAAAPPAAP